MPGLPLGLVASEYSSRVLQALALNSASILTGGGALLLRSRMRQTDETLRRLAFYDAMTGLANRALFEDRLEHSLSQSRRRGEPLALLFIDLGQFKQMNDRFGHATGDRVLADLVQRLNRCVRVGDTVARIGGDEFTMLIENGSRDNVAEEIAARILEELAAPFRLDGGEWAISASIGIAITNGDLVEAADLLRDADAALYEAKSRGRGQYVVFRSNNLSSTSGHAA